MNLFEPSSDSEICDCVIVGSQNLRISENFVAESVQTSHRDSDVGGRDPVLQLRAVLEVEGRRSALQGGEGHVGRGQRGHVGKV